MCIQHLFAVYELIEVSYSLCTKFHRLRLSRGGHSFCLTLFYTLNFITTKRLTANQNVKLNIADVEVLLRRKFQSRTGEFGRQIDVDSRVGV